MRGGEGGVVVLGKGKGCGGGGGVVVVLGKGKGSWVALKQSN